MSGTPEQQQFDQAVTELGRIRATLTTAIVGQERLIGDLLNAVFAGGHVLLEGLPGLGKTHLAKALAAAFGYPLARIQCTPDLMPADITGSEVLRGNQVGTFQPGPLFQHVVLVDEINRATPRTQAAFLEAMQEQQITHMGERHPLPDPFWVLATQNPIELEGTYPLPEAQLDRFMVKLIVSYPSADMLGTLLDVSLDKEPSELIKPVLAPGDVERIMRLARHVVIADPIKQAAIDLVLATQPQHSDCHPRARETVRYGASPRGLQSLLRAARVNALTHNRAHVALEDLRQVAVPVLRHRLLLNFESEVDGLTVDALLAEILADHLHDLR